MYYDHRTHRWMPWWVLPDERADDDNSFALHKAVSAGFLPNCHIDSDGGVLDVIYVSVRDGTIKLTENGWAGFVRKFPVLNDAPFF